jgi:predicted DNA repair protein MutK
MASSFLMLLDDIATVLDDVSVLTKVAAKKTSGVLGDDLALNAQQVIGVRAERELPIVWAVCKGSLLNKAILVPAALAISVFMPSLVTPLLMIGGAYLCFEGFEKVWHVLFHSKDDQKKHAEKHKEHLALTPEKLIEIEKEKITGAVRTDFILSAEIIAITLGTVQESSLGVKAAVLSGIALIMTLGVYGLVAFIVKIDDIGLHLVTHSKTAGFNKTLGTAMLKFAPILMKFLSIAGTAAMFLVGGGIFTHGLPWVHHLSEHVVTNTAVGVLFDGAVGAIVGLICFLMVTTVQKFRKQPQPAA